MKTPYNIIAQFYNNEITAKENEILQNWLAKSAENKQIFDDYKEIWELSKSDNSEPNFEVENALLNVNSKLKEKKNPRIGIKQILMIAASLVVLFGVYFFGFQKDTVNNFAYSEFENETDSTMFVELPDNSKVWLKSGSEIKFEENFNDSLRKVILTGTAYFEVEHNSAKAFVVSCKNTEIKVLGTKFNVEIEDNSVKTNLLEGKIKFYESKNIKNSVILKPNELAVFNEENSVITKQKFKNKNCLAWKTKILEFDEIVFSEVINELENLYNKKIEIKNDELKNYSFSGSFDNKTFEEVLNILQISLQVQIIEKNNKIIIY